MQPEIRNNRCHICRAPLGGRAIAFEQSLRREGVQELDTIAHLEALAAELLVAQVAVNQDEEQEVVDLAVAEEDDNDIELVTLD